MKEEALAEIPDYMQSSSLIVKHLNCPKTRITNLAKKAFTQVPGWVFFFQTLGLKIRTTPLGRECERDTSHFVAVVVNPLVGCIHLNIFRGKIKF